MENKGYVVQPQGTDKYKVMKNNCEFIIDAEGEDGTVEEFSYENVDVESIMNTFSIEYSLNGGINNSSNPNSYRSNSDTITLQCPTKSGYYFLGWTGSNGKTKQTNVTIEKGSTGNKSYTANWSLTEYKVTVGLQALVRYGSGGANNFDTIISGTLQNLSFTGW